MNELDRRGIRLAELVAVLSLGTDLGLGQPMEHVLRQCLIALRIAERPDLDEEERAVLYYTALLAYVGCHVDAHEQAKWFGDDLVAKADARMFDFDGGRSDVAYLIGHLGAGRPPLERLRLGMAFLSGAGRRAAGAMFDNHWLATAGLARALQLGDPVLDSLEQTFERWDGRGLCQARGARCPVTARVTAPALPSRSVPGLEQDLRDPDPKVRRAAAREAAKDGDAKLLLEASRDRDQEVAITATDGLGKLHARGELPASELIARVVDKAIDERVRVSAINGLGVVASPEASKTLVEL
ncbi:MAG: hypothetical protein KY463_14875, partial [Actinobacteria bacterium]|nr:hypothetical protein [Actinomycetota bacterium]